MISLEKLKQEKVWLCYIVKEEDGRVKKLPKNPHLNENASVDNPNTWDTYDYCKNAVPSLNYDGVGFVFTELNDYCLAGIDIDSHTGDNKYTTEILKLFKDTYAEKSPSKKGIHILFLIKKDKISCYDERYYKKNAEKELECYVAGCTKRYFTFTEDIINDKPIADMTEQWLDFLNKYMVKNTLPPKIKVADKFADILNVARNSKNGEKFKALYDKGDISSYSNDISKADLALCNILAFYTRGNFDDIDAMFKKSALYREKWDRQDYKEKTINKAISSCSSYYNPPRKQNNETEIKKETKTDEKKSFEKETESSEKYFIDKLDNGKKSVNEPKFIDWFQANYQYYFITQKGENCNQIIFYEDGVYKKVESLDRYVYKKIPKELVKMNLVKNLSGLLQLETNRCIDESELNNNEDIINFKNGILRLSTMELEPHSPDFKTTVQLPINYEKNNKTPIFDAYINDIAGGDEATKTLLIEFIGAALSNVCGYRYKKALLLIGAGNTGKSVYREFLNQLLGTDNESSASLSAIEARFGTSNIYRKRLCGPSDGGCLNVGQLEIFKGITGGDSISVEFKNKNPFEYKYKGFVFIGANSLPKFAGDRGSWVYERMLIIPCENVIPEERRNKRLVEDLMEEAPGIVYKALCALKKTIDRGYRFTIPQKSQGIMEEYKRKNSPYIDFYYTCCEAIGDADRKPGKGIKKSLLLKSARRWINDNAQGTKFKKGDLMNEFENNNINLSTSIYNGYELFNSFTLKEEYRKYYEENSGREALIS